MRDLSETTSNELMKKSRYVVFDKKEMETKFIGTRINEGGTVGWFVRKLLLPSEKCLQWTDITPDTLVSDLMDIRLAVPGASPSIEAMFAH